MSPWRDKKAWWRKEAEAFQDGRSKSNSTESKWHRRFPAMFLAIDFAGFVIKRYWDKWTKGHHT